MENKTRDWILFEAGKKYNNSLKPSYYETVDANLAFFEGEQWRNLEGAENMPKPVFNIIKRVGTFFVSSLTTSKTKLHFEPLLNVNNGDEEELTPSDFANAMVSNLFEKFKMDFRIKDALFDGVKTGDYAAHFFFDTSKQPYGYQSSEHEGEIEMELVDGSNVFFGNANNPRVDVQPYIIISGRDMVQNLKDEAKQYQQSEQEVNAIQSDKDYNEQSGDSGKIEVETDIEGDQYGKALYIIVYRKKKVKRPMLDESGQPRLDENGKPMTEEVMAITASKSVENAYIYKDIDTGLSHYPIAWGNWEKQKNQYHGRALCTGLLPNQIFINRMFAMVMYHLMMTAFPKAVYNADIISGWDNGIGTAIPVSGADMSAPIKNVAGYLEPGNMSNQIIQTIELAMQYTKETLGISDAALGSIDPKNTSAIIAVQKSSAIPLENPKANLYEWIEDIGKILLDMMGTYYGQRPVVMEIDGVKQEVMYDFTTFKDTWLNVRADVGEASYWSEISSLSTLDRLLEMEKIDFVDYLERVGEEYIPQKEELISKIKQQMEQAKMMANDPMNAIAGLTPEEQQAFYSASPEQQQQILLQLQQQPAPMM